MSYKHIDELALESWFKRPWILLGTGESLDNFNAVDWTDHNIAAIYDAYYAAPNCDILFYSDSWMIDTLPYINDGSAISARHIATRSINVQFLHYFFKYENVVMWDYDCDKNNYGIRLFNDKTQYPCSNTSSFIVFWLGTMGVREIKTWGIDGGFGVSSIVSKDYSKGCKEGSGWNPNIENEGVYGHAKNFGIKMIKM